MHSIVEKAWLAVLGLVVAVIGVVSPMVWDWWNKRSELTIDTKSVAMVASSAQPIPGLEFFFNGSKISAVSRFDIEFRNTGRTPVTKEDVVTPLSINFGDGEILDAGISRQSPENLNASLKAEHNQLTVSFSLLNPNEFLAIEVLTTSQQPAVQASARIKNISQIEVVSTARSKAIDSKFAVPILLVVGLNCTIWLMFIFFLISDSKKNFRALKMLRADSYPLLSAGSRAEALDHLYRDMDFPERPMIGKVDAAIGTANWPLDIPAREKLRYEIMEALKKRNNVDLAFGVLFAVSMIVLLLSSLLLTVYPA